jgi:hypothetical protein
MTRYAEKEWDHFLHATEVGRALDHFGQICSGVLSEAESAVKGVWNLSPARALIDPKGFWHSLSGSVEKFESLTGLDGKQKLEESWKELGKDVVHLDEWSTNPLKAAGESAFDLGTLLLPGGALSKLSKFGHLAEDVAEAPKGLRLPTPGRLPNPAPHDNPPARNDPPKTGQPEPAPKPKGTLPPYGLTESKTPVETKPPATTSKHVAEPATPAGHAPPSAPTDKPDPPGAPPAPVPHSPTHGGAPSGLSPQAPTLDHHGPVAHAEQPLTTGDLSALADYTGLGHEDLNDALRNGPMDASRQARVDALNHALEKLPPHSGMVYRGADLAPDVLAQYQRGAVVTEHAFLSSSLDPAVANSSAFAGNVEFRIASKTGRDVSSFSTFPTEQEVLFPTGLQFYVVDRRSDPLTGKTIIEMAER